MTDRAEEKSYGVRERTARNDEVAFHVERIRLAGYSVLKTDFSETQVADLGARLDAVLERQSREFGGPERLATIGDALTARCPLVYDDAFLRLATYAPLLTLCRHLLGDYFVLMQQNGIVNPSGEGHTQASYHRDLPYQHFVSSRPLAVSALFCIDPFRVETGATTVLVGSHRVEEFPSIDVAATVDVPVTAEPGSFLVFDSMLFHRAGANRSGRVRRGVNHVFTVPIIAQQISLPAALGGRYADDPVLARLLGYEAEPASSATDWRERRLRRVALRRDPPAAEP
jgi:ectoine hydroxylase-related dioxygenase (phytanoyl-CoA dioxygenase family)